MDRKDFIGPEGARIELTLNPEELKIILTACEGLIGIINPGSNLTERARSNDNGVVDIQHLLRILAQPVGIYATIELSESSEPPIKVEPGAAGSNDKLPQWMQDSITLANTRYIAIRSKEDAFQSRYSSRGTQRIPRRRPRRRY